MFINPEFKSGVRIYKHGVRIYKPGVRIYKPEVRIYKSGVHIFKSGVRIYKSKAITSLTLGAHAQRGLRYLVCVSVCVSVCVCYSTSHFSRDYSCHKRYNLLSGG